MAFLLIVLLVFKNGILVRNKKNFLGQTLYGGVHKWREAQAVSSMYMTYDLC